MSVLVKAPVAVALDAPDARTAAGWARTLAPYLTTVKVGLELFTRCGPGVVDAVREAVREAVGEGQGDDVCDLFLDLKLHDIPNTVAGAARSVATLRPRYLTVHATGGRAMVAAAAEAAPDVRIAAVTVLTSMSEDDLAAVGLRGPASEAVLRLARLAVDAGARALVCSPHEVAAVRAEVGPGITLIVPGVRPAGYASATGADDQSRVATPEAALADGADLLVIGRPLTAAADPVAAAVALAVALGSR